ncbi:unnamed protein product [Diamesa serratosioi]
MENKIVSSILLIGFHHKKGWQIEYEFPTREKEKSHYEDSIPTLALPDQSHKFQQDTVFFSLPTSSTTDIQPVYGVACFFQISAESYRSKSKSNIDNSEITRSSVQKSVVALLNVPAFGYIEVKLKLITQALFDEGDFLSGNLLKQSFQQLNSCFLAESFCDEKYISGNNFNGIIHHMHIGFSLRDLILEWRHKFFLLFKLFLLEKRVIFFGSPVKPVCSLIIAITSLHPRLLTHGLNEAAISKTTTFEEPSSILSTDDTLTNQIDATVPQDNSSSLEKTTTDDIKDKFLPTIPDDEYLSPMPIFENNYLLLPFISLPYMDILTDKNNRGFIVGASNVLFKQKMQLADVIVDVQSLMIDSSNAELRKQLEMSIEDLRFLDYILKGLLNPKSCEGVGTDNWIRQQFTSYFISMLRTLYGNDDFESFNENFMLCWRETHNYQEWLRKKKLFDIQHPERKLFDNFSCGNPFSKSGSGSNVADLKMRFSQSIHNTESGRKINQALNNSLSNAKSWFSSLTTFKDEKNMESSKLSKTIESNAEDNEGS